MDGPETGHCCCGDEEVEWSLVLRGTDCVERPALLALMPLAVTCGSIQNQD